MELLELRRPREEVKVGCALLMLFAALLDWAAAAAAAATAAAVEVEVAEVEAGCDFEAGVLEGAGLLGEEVEGWFAALWARKATSRLARNGLLVGIAMGAVGRGWGEWVMATDGRSLATDG